MSFRKATIEEARASYKPLRRRQIARQAAPKKSVPVSPAKRVAAKPAPRVRKRRSLKTKADPELAAWSKRVRGRDGNACQFPDCRTGDSRIDPHHIAPRSRRPDLIYIDENGICLCRTHHNWCHDNPRQAEATQLLNFDSYELAQKIKQGYVVPGDEDDTRITL